MDPLTGKTKARNRDRLYLPLLLFESGTLSSLGKVDAKWELTNIRRTDLLIRKLGTETSNFKVSIATYFCY